MFFRSVVQRQDGPALHFRQAGNYRTISWNGLAADVRRLSAALTHAGVQPGDRVAQVAENRYEWIVADLAILLARAVHVPIHVTLSGAQIDYQIKHSGAEMVFLSGKAEADVLTEQTRAGAPPTFVSYDDWPDRATHQLPTVLLSEFTERFADDGPPGITQQFQQQWLQDILPTDLATILYTSGTTGTAKGVMLSHRNLASNAQATCEAYGGEIDELRLCFLPLSHVYARTCDLYTWVYQGSQIALAENRDTVLADCKQIRPTVLNAVPYFYDKIRSQLSAAGVADKATALRELLGGQIRVCFCGGAALPNEVTEFFQQCRVPLFQGYGLSEASPVVSLSTADAHKIGAVGRPIPGVEVRLAEDGEILTRGPHVMMGYWRDDEATSETIRDGWLYTGDLGSLDAEGRLTIRGRKKDLIVTATGKNIAPSYLESLLSSSCLISQVIVIGDGRNYLTALIVPDPDNLRAQIIARGICVKTPDQAITDPNVLELFRNEVDERLHGLSRHEQIGRFTLIGRPFLPDRGEVTPKLSLRRDVIQTNFSGEIEKMYHGSIDNPNVAG